MVRRAGAMRFWRLTGRSLDGGLALSHIAVGKALIDMKRIAPCPVSTVIRRFSSKCSQKDGHLLRRRRVVVTGIGAITPLGPTMDSTWKAVLQTKDDSGNRRSQNSGITSLYSALKQQNLSTEQFEKVCAQNCGHHRHLMLSVVLLFL